MMLTFFLSTKRRRLDNSDMNSSRKEVTRCNTEQLTEIMTKVMQILEQHPQLLVFQKEALITIRSRVKVISPTYETAEFKLFSKLLDHSTVNISTAENDSYKVNAALLVFHSRVVEQSFRFDGIDDLNHLQLSNFKGKDIQKLVRILENKNFNQIEVDDLGGLLALVDYLDIPLLLESIQRSFSRIEQLTEKEVGQIVSLLNEDFIDHHPSIKAKLEQLISKFFITAFENPIQDNYLIIKRTIKELKRPITLDFSNGKFGNFHLTQIRKIPLKSINLTNCCNLTSDCIHFLKEIQGLEEINLENNIVF